MWARVKFTIDKDQSNRPLTYFDECKTVQKELQEGIIMPQYYVFWSPLDNETPEDVKAREGRILKIDKVINSLNRESPVAGYYSAELWNYAESQEALELLLSQRQGRRPLKATVTSKKNEAQQTKRLENKKKAEMVKAAREFNHKILGDGNKKSAGDKETRELPQNKSKQIENELSQDTPNEIDNTQSPSKRQKTDPNNQADSDSCDGTVPLVEYRRISDELRELQNGWSQANLVWKEKWMQVQQEIKLLKEKNSALESKNPHDNKELENLKEENETLKRKEKEERQTEDYFIKANAQLEEKNNAMKKELEEYKSLNKWWQQQEIKRKDSHRSSSSRHSSSSSRRLPSSSSSKSHSSSIPSTLPSTLRSVEVPSTPSPISKSKQSSDPGSILKPAATSSPSTSSSNAPLPPFITPPSKRHVFEPSCIPSTSSSPVLSSSKSKPSTSNGNSVLLANSPNNSANNSCSFTMSPDADISWQDGLSAEDISSVASIVIPLNLSDSEMDGSATPTNTPQHSVRPANVVPDPPMELAGEGVQSREEKRKIELELDDDDVAFGITEDGVDSLSHGQFKACRTVGFGPTKASKAGDSLFCKNVYGVLYNKQQLSSRSAAGKPPTTTDGAARPQGSPQKKHYVARLLMKRIELEEPNISEFELKDRTKQSKINKYLREKIKAARRTKPSTKNGNTTTAVVDNA